MIPEIFVIITAFIGCFILLTTHYKIHNAVLKVNNYIAAGILFLVGIYVFAHVIVFTTAIALTEGKIKAELKTKENGTTQWVISRRIK